MKNELDKLKREMEIVDNDWELGKKSPRDLAIKWLCRAVYVSSCERKNDEMLMNAIDRLIALDNAQNGEHKGSCEKYEFFIPKVSPEEISRCPTLQKPR